MCFAMTNRCSFTTLRRACIISATLNAPDRITSRCMVTSTMFHRIASALASFLSSVGTQRFTQVWPGAGAASDRACVRVDIDQLSHGTGAPQARSLRKTVQRPFLCTLSRVVSALAATWPATSASSDNAHGRAPAQRAGGSHLDSPVTSL